MTAYLFLTIVLLSLTLFYYATGKSPRILVTSIAWIIIVSIPGYLGFFKNTSSFPPRFLLILFGALLFGIFTYRIIDKNKTKLTAIFAIHCIRLPVEIVLFQLFKQGLIPELMTFEGWNYDILIGISAIVWLLYLQMSHSAIRSNILLSWNILGFIMLTIIVTLAILSAPLPIQQLAYEQPNIGVLQFPYVLLPGFVVPIVYISHILEINRLLSQRSSPKHA